MENISLSEILLNITLFSTHPTEENQKRMENDWHKIVVRQYIPLEEKIELMPLIIDQAVEDTDNAFILAMRIEIAKVIIGLINGYCVNVENDLNIYSLQLSVYDELYSSGFVDYILEQGCVKDYNRFETLVENALNFTNLMNLLQGFTSIDPDNMESFNKMIDSMNNELTPEKIDLLKGLVANGVSDAGKALDSKMASEALKEALGDKIVEQNNVWKTSLDVMANLDQAKAEYEEAEKELAEMDKKDSESNTAE